MKGVPSNVRSPHGHVFSSLVNDSALHNTIYLSPMTPELERAVERYRQWFGSYKKSGELIKVQVWLTVNNGCIEFLSLDDSYKVKRIRRNPRVICYIGDKGGPQIAGTGKIVMGRDAPWRVYRAYWKTHPLVMAVIALPIRRRIKTRKQVLIRVRPDEPNPLAGVTDPVL
jgi:hypothetical protein